MAETISDLRADWWTVAVDAHRKTAHTSCKRVVMNLPRLCLPALSVLFGAALPLAPQSVVSTHAGVVNYFEGAVSVAGAALRAQFGRFPEIPEGAELRTTEGRAEVLLSPGVILRIAENGALKMLSSNLADTRVEILSGAAIVDSKDALPGNHLVLLYKDWQIRVPKHGVYRIDSDPEQLRVYSGEVEVSASGNPPANVKADQTLPLAALLIPEETLGPPGDGFNRWSFDRGEALAADNAIAAEIVDDPALYPGLADTSGLAFAGYTYFPTTIGNPYVGYSTYGALNPYVGSYYGLPYGVMYTYRPVYTGLPNRDPGSPLNIRRGVGYPTARPGIPSPPISHPGPAPRAGPVSHPAPHPGIRGGHR
jgi:hypothetical protein